jgi:hypothetical protein
VNTSAEVLEAARRRAEALAAGDAQALRLLLHPQFRWVAHTGERFDRDSYAASITSPVELVASEELADADIVMHDQTAVLRCQVLQPGEGGEALPMSMTQVWVLHDDHWVCLVGHVSAALSPAS